MFCHFPFFFSFSISFFLLLLFPSSSFSSRVLILMMLLLSGQSKIVPGVGIGFGSQGELSSHEMVGRTLHWSFRRLTLVLVFKYLYPLEWNSGFLSSHSMLSQSHLYFFRFYAVDLCIVCMLNPIGNYQVLWGFHLQ